MRWILVCLLGAVLACGCSRGGAPSVAGAEREPSVRGQALIDSGNASYRRADYATAAKRYASAAVLVPDEPAAFYGLGMALAKLGRDEDARSAYAKARELGAKRGERPHEPSGPPANAH